MTTQEVKRKLTAILSADVKGYSRLMGEDEEWTLRTLNTYKEVMRSLIQQYRGRVVNAPGDNVLAEFVSVVDAVQCAVEIQQVLRARNAVLPEHRRMKFRIGINLGDVIEEGDSIYGDGVNIAARLEGLAEAGGICISESAYQQIENKLPLRYEYLGEHEVKNIAKPVRAYRTQIEPGEPSQAKVKTKVEGKRWKYWIGAMVVVILAVAALWQFVWRPSHRVEEKADLKKLAHPLPDKPSIAVLPFVSMSGDKEQELFCDGLTDTIITSLSHIPHLFVIASNSTFTYKGKPVKVQQVAEELGVQYVLEGSVQKAERKIRVRAQLIDALSGRHMWAESYDRDLKDIFAVQDDITRNILTSLQVELTSGEYARAIGKGTKSLEALQLVWRSQYHLLRLTKEDMALARQYAEKAIEIDPSFAFAWAEVGFAHNLDSISGWSSSREQSLNLAEQCAQKALSLNPSESKAYLLLYQIAINKRETDKAVEYAQKALEINPNDIWAFTFLGRALLMVGRHEEAIVNVRKAMRLTPYYPSTPVGLLGWSSFFLRRYEDALSSAEDCLKRSKAGELWIVHLLMVAIYSEIGQEEKARKFGAEITSANPNWNLEVFRRFFPLKNQSDTDRILNAARKAGLK